MAYRTTSQQSRPQVVPTQQARQGIAFGHVRYVLAGSLALAVVAGVIIWLAFFA